MQNVAIVPAGHGACLVIGERHGPQKPVKNSVPEQTQTPVLRQYTVAMMPLS